MKFILKNWVLLFATALLAVVGIICLRGCGVEAESGTDDGREHRFKKGQIVMRTPEKHRKAKPSRRAYRADAEHRTAEVKLLDKETGEIDNGQYDDFTGHDREIARVIDTAFWDDDMTNTLAAAMEAVSSQNRELRAKAVEMAAWYGKDGMETLMLYMADPDEEIAEDAREAWVEGLRDVDNDEDRASLVAPLSKVLTDPDTIDGMLMALNDLPNIAQMQVMIDIIDTGTEEAYKVALEHYEFMTGEEFTTVEAAQAWLNANWEEEQCDRQEAAANGFEADIDAVVQATGLDKEKVLSAMGVEAEALNMTDEEYFDALDRKAQESGKTRAEFIAEMLKDTPELKASGTPEAETPDEGAREFRNRHPEDGAVVP